MSLRRWCPALILTLAAASGLGACGLARPDAAAAAATADRFYRAIAAADAARACTLLAPATVESLEEDTGQPCDDAILDGETGDTLDARTGGAADPTSRVAGRQAQVTLSTDVLFLTVSGDHWVITAAGCDARPDRPYDCVLEGS